MRTVAETGIAAKPCYALSALRRRHDPHPQAGRIALGLRRWFGLTGFRPGQEEVLCAVVDGESVTIDSEAGSHLLNYAETIVIPAVVGRYWLMRAGKELVRIVKVLVC